MSLRKSFVLLLTGLATLAMTAQGCQSGGVGDPCVPEDEYSPDFAGFNAKEVNVESRSFQCETRVCLVNHFRGRVSCPLGQTSDVAKGAADYASNGSNQTSGFDPTRPDACRIPGSSGKAAEVVTVPVTAQCIDRKAQDVVYCSKKCSANDDCPDGYTCSEIKELALGAAVATKSGQLSGKYCIKSAANLDYNSPTTAKCDGDIDPCDKSGICNGVTANP